MINATKGGELALRVFNGSLSLSFSCSSLLCCFFFSSLPFSWFAAFCAICRFCGFFLFWMTFLSFSLSFGLLAVLHVSWIQNSNFVPFIVNVLIKWEIEKPSGQHLGLIVISH
jgi:hypothetical protein